MTSTPGPRRPRSAGRRGARNLPLLLLLAGVLAGAIGLTAAARPVEAEAEPQSFIVVRHVYYRATDGSIAVEETVSRVVAQFVVNPHTWATSALPVTVNYNGTGQPSGHNVPSLIQQAIGTWNAAGSAFSFVYGGETAANTGSCADSPAVDGVNTIAFNDGINQLSLGETCTIYPNTGPNTKLVEFDMRLDPDAETWSSSAQTPPDKYDLPTTILHELGHAAGIGHSAVNSSVMFYQLNDGDQRRTLHADDIAAIRQAYPASATQVPTTAVPTSAPPTATPPPITTVPPPQGTFKVRTLQLARD